PRRLSSLARRPPRVWYNTPHIPASDVQPVPRPGVQPCGRDGRRFFHEETAMVLVRQGGRRWQAGVLLAVLAVAGARATAQDDPVVARMRKDITYLASEECEGRGVFTKGIEKAADYIANSFKQSGLKPGGPDGSYFQPFPISRGAGKLQGT